MFAKAQDTQRDEIDSLDMGDMIGMFKAIADNPLSKFFLKRTVDYCEKDGANSLEVGLEIHLGERKKACSRCMLLSKFIGYIVGKGISSFGVQEDEFKKIMEDHYWIKGLSSVLKGIGIFGVRKPFIPGAPFQIVWNLTRACNMRCAHCYENAGRKDADELTRDQVISGLDIIAKAGVTSVAFSGGEPTVHPHIFDFISHANDLGMFVAMATNGYSLSKGNACQKYVDAGLEFVQISIDGVDPETHDSFRGVNGSWVKAVQAVENCIEADLFVEVATTVTEHNLKEIPEIIDFIRDLGTDWFMIYNFIPTGNGESIVKMDISPQKRFRLLQTAYAENANGDMQILSTAPQYAMVAESLLSKQSPVIPTHFYNPEYTNLTMMQLADFIGGCGAGRFYMNIEPNGDMYPCVFFPHEKDVMLGNLLEDDFEDVWKDNILLNRLRNKDILEGHCGVCESRNICGGCRARAYNYFHNVLAPDPGCINNEAEWKEIRSKIQNEIKELPNHNFFIDFKAG